MNSAYNSEANPDKKWQQLIIILLAAAVLVILLGATALTYLIQRMQNNPYTRTPNYDLMRLTAACFDKSKQQDIIRLNDTISKTNVKDINTKKEALAAARRLQDAQDEYSRIVGEPNAVSDTCYTPLALLYEKAGDLSSAIAVSKKCVDGAIKSSGSESAWTAAARRNLGYYYRQNSQPDKAEEQYRLCLAVREKYTGKESTDTVAAIEDLGGALAEEKKWNEAEGDFKQALQVRQKKKLGMEWTGWEWLGWISHRQHHYEDAKTSLEHALSDREIPAEARTRVEEELKNVNAAITAKHST